MPRMTKTPRTLLRARTRVALATVLGACALLLTACGGSSGASTTSSRQKGAKHAHTAPAAAAVFTFHHLYSLPSQLRDAAFAALGGSRFVLAGGLSAADVSTDEVWVAGLHGITARGTLPGAQHDASAAGLAGAAYVFGGGNLSQYDHIFKIDPAGPSVQTAGRLPSVASDVAVTAIGTTAYIVGGYNGTSSLNTVVAYVPGRAPRVVGHIPAALRYAAVTPGPIGQILVIGGTTPAGASREVYIFNPATGHSRVLARLRHPITHAGAVTIGGYAYLIGGRSDSDSGQTNAIWSINTATGALKPAGHLPAPTSDAAVLTVGRRVIVAGGLTPSGTTLAEVGQLIPAP